MIILLFRNRLIWRLMEYTVRCNLALCRSSSTSGWFTRCQHDILKSDFISMPNNLAAIYSTPIYIASRAQTERGAKGPVRCEVKSAPENQQIYSILEIRGGHHPPPSATSLPTQDRRIAILGNTQTLCDIMYVLLFLHPAHRFDPSVSPLV